MTSATLRSVVPPLNSPLRRRPEANLLAGVPARGGEKGARAFTAALLAAALAAAPAFADQSNTWLPNTGALPGLTMVNDLNGSFAALQSCNSGASAPANTQSGTPSL